MVAGETLLEAQEHAMGMLKWRITQSRNCATPIWGINTILVTTKEGIRVIKK